MQKVQAYIVGAFLMFGSALWASIFAQNITTVIALLAVPSLLVGYVYATNLPQYVWGMLLGVWGYMAVEFQLYGPVYNHTGLVYGEGFLCSLCCAIAGYSPCRWKTKWQLNHKKIIE